MATSTSSSRRAALAAELLADLLIETYQQEQVDWSVGGFARAGFTRSSLPHGEKIFQMIVIAAYDRRPFTGAIGGFEQLWEMTSDPTGIPTRLRSVGLWSTETVLATTEGEIRSRLAGLEVAGCRLDGQGTGVRFSQTLIDSARLAGSGFTAELAQASSTHEISQAFEKFNSVHGVGETIAAKLTKYTLREIAIGQTQPRLFPIGVAWPLTREYHVEQAASILRRIGPDVVPLTAGLLCARGDAFAIDALFYLHRHRRQTLEEFASDWLEEPRPARQVSPAQDVDARAICSQLMNVVQEIVDDGRAVTQVDLDRAGLKEIMTRQRIVGSCLFLLQGMSEHAQHANIGQMLAFYENCLRSPDGQDIGWALTQVHRKSMESEAERFRTIAQRAPGEPD